MGKTEGVDNLETLKGNDSQYGEFLTMTYIVNRRLRTGHLVSCLY